MREQAVEPKNPEIVMADIDFIKGFGNYFVNKIKRIGVAGEVPHHQVSNQDVVLRVALVLIDFGRWTSVIVLRHALFDRQNRVCGLVEEDTNAVKLFPH